MLFLKNKKSCDFINAVSILVINDGHEITLAPASESRHLIFNLLLPGIINCAANSTG